MKFIYQFLILSVFLGQSIFAQGQPQFIQDSAIKVDGSGDDWSSIKTIFSDFGSTSAGKGFLDVKETKMAFSTSHLYFLIELDGELGKWKPESDQSVFQIYFDVDANQNTGCSKLKAYEAKIMGYEYRLEVTTQKSGKFTAKLFSKSDNFQKELMDLTEDDQFLKVKGKSIEFKVSLDTINVINEGLTKVRFLFAEFANSKKGDGYSKIVYALNFKATAKESAGVAEAGGGEDSGFGIWHLMVLTIWIVSILCAFAIAPKAGLSTGLALINLVPFLGQLAFLFILAFNKWPLHADYHALEERIRELEQQEEY